MGQAAPVDRANLGVAEEGDHQVDEGDHQVRQKPRLQILQGDVLKVGETNKDIQTPLEGVYRYETYHDISICGIII